MKMETQYQVIVFGRVQGVGFRATARRMARSLRLKGWVENLPDGSVKLVFKGDPGKCNRFIKWCREGSGYSWVEGINILDMKPEPLDHFEIRY
jgi:acylphosphatase